MSNRRYPKVNVQAQVHGEMLVARNEPHMVKQVSGPDLELARRFGFGGLSEADLDPKNYHRALEKQVNRPSDLTRACMGGDRS